MASRGKSENDTLKQNLTDQVDRLVRELADLEESKDEFSAEEYEELINDTVEQLKEIRQSLDNLTKGDISLVNELNSLRNSLEDVISKAFKTSEVKSTFANKAPEQLKVQLNQIERNYKLGKIIESSYNQEKYETLVKLQKLGENLTPEQILFLSEHNKTSVSQYQEIKGDSNSDNVLQSASTEINKINR